MGRRMVTLCVVLVSTFTFPLTIGGASVALPAIRADLGASLAATQWVVNGYNATFAGCLVFAGSLSDVLGRRRIYATGLAVLVACGAVSTVATDVLVLDVVRVLAGVGAAAAVTGGSSILSVAFDGAARTRAFGMLGMTIGAGLAFGPTLGGLLVDTLGWRAVFALPAALALLVLAVVPVLPRGPRAGPRRVDLAGGLLFTGALLALIFALVEGPALGFAAPAVLVALVVVVAAGVGFVVVQRRVPDPVLHLGLLANRRFTASCLAAGSIVVVMVPMLVYLPSYLIAVVGLAAGPAGVWLLLLTVPAMVLPAVGGALARRMPPAVLVTGCVLVTGAGAFGLLTLGPGETVLGFALPAALTGAGFGLSTGLLDGQAITAVGTEQSGIAAGMFNTARLTSETVAIAVVGAALAALSGGTLAGPAYTTALHAVCLVLGCFAVLAAVAVAVLSAAAARPALRTAARAATSGPRRG